MSTPSVGRIVHFQTYGTPGGEFPSALVAAIITAVHDRDPGPEHGVPYVDLFTIYPNGTSHKANIRYAEQPTPGCWNWPPRV